jgi:hypothetical protein
MGILEGVLRQGLNRVARKAGSRGAASCGGDLGSPRKAAGPAAAGRGLPVKARLPPKNVLLRPEKSKKKGAEAPLLTLRFKIISLLPPVCG